MTTERKLVQASAERKLVFSFAEGSRDKLKASEDIQKALVAEIVTRV